jgi:hypothetical protein
VGMTLTAAAATGQSAVSAAFDDTVHVTPERTAFLPLWTLRT